MLRRDRILPRSSPHLASLLSILLWGLSCSAPQPAGSGDQTPGACSTDEECEQLGPRAACREGRCLCEPSCLTRDCGRDGCGGTCGACECGNTCRSGVCKAQIADIWVGTYACRQGRTGLILEIHGSSDDLRAHFTFYALPSNPGVPTGSYVLRGSFDCDGTFRLEPHEWLEQPPDYTMVGLDGAIARDGQTLQGSVTAASCDRFRLQR